MRRGQQDAGVCRFFMLFAMANSGLPGTSGFVGEFLVVMGAMQSTSGTGARRYYAVVRAAYTLLDVQACCIRCGRHSHVEALAISGHAKAVLALAAIAYSASGCTRRHSLRCCTIRSATCCGWRRRANSEMEHEIPISCWPPRDLRADDGLGDPHRRSVSADRLRV